MADLLVIAELTPPPHNACRLGFDDRPPLWLGFQPNWGNDVPSGRIETKPRSHEHHHFARFSVEDDSVLEEARHRVFREWEAGRKINDQNYEARNYYPFVRDCITFARDVAEACGLRTGVWYEPPGAKVDFWPQELLIRLFRFNTDRVIESNLTSLGISYDEP